MYISNLTTRETENSREKKKGNDSHNHSSLSPSQHNNPNTYIYIYDVCVYIFSTQPTLNTDQNPRNLAQNQISNLVKNI